MCRRVGKMTRATAAVALPTALVASFLVASGSSFAFSRENHDDSRGVVRVDDTTSDDFGTDHAFIIGINGYAIWPTLTFAEGDATDIGQILVEEYGFETGKVTYLLGADATRSNVLRELRGKLESLRENDNLFIYYAGHGQLDPLTETGFWVPVDGGLYEEDTWIAFSRVRELVTASGVKIKNLILVTDSCYGGDITRGGPTPGHRGPDTLGYEQYEEQLRGLSRTHSRQAIASGGYEQVPDRSEFAALLKYALRNNPNPVVDMEYLFYRDIYLNLRDNQQEPIMGRLATGPEFSGQFVLRKGDYSPPPEEEPARAVIIHGFGASPGRITAGEASSLTWRTSNAERVQIGGVGDVSLSGSETVRPATTTTYTLVAQDSAGRSTERSVTIVVGSFAVPAPTLAFDSTERYQAGGRQWVRYRLKVTNSGSYPEELFAPAPDLPPCGRNTNASRTWVDIHDAATDRRIYGFCAFSSSDGLNALWFAAAEGTAPPRRIYILLRDRREGNVYRSNDVTIP